MISGSYLTDTYINKEHEKNQDSYSDGFDNRWFSYTSTTETQRSWPRIISSLGDVPSYFKDYFYIEANTFPYTVFIPEDIVIIHARARQMNPKLISLYNEKIIILEKTKKGINQQYHNFYGINYLMIESILLTSGFKISSSNVVSQVYFNSVRDDFFKKIEVKK